MSDLSLRMRNYAAVIQPGGDHGVGGNIRWFADEVDALEAKLGAMELAIEAAKREIASIRCGEDERYARNALIILAAAQQE